MRDLKHIGGGIEDVMRRQLVRRIDMKYHENAWEAARTMRLDVGNPIREQIYDSLQVLQ